MNISSAGLELDAPDRNRLPQATAPRRPAVLLKTLTRSAMVAPLALLAFFILALMLCCRLLFVLVLAVIRP
jgi:hypothetical protein